MGRKLNITAPDASLPQRDHTPVLQPWFYSTGRTTVVRRSHPSRVLRHMDAWRQDYQGIME